MGLAGSAAARRPARSVAVLEGSSSTESLLNKPGIRLAWAARKIFVRCFAHASNARTIPPPRMASDFRQRGWAEEWTACHEKHLGFSVDFLLFRARVSTHGEKL
jgi:hypothetical protein